MSMRWLRWWIVGYAATLGVVAWSMWVARDRAIERLSTPQSLAQWQAWREDVRREQIEPGPVERRVPKSGEPPALVLMRDYFAVSLFGAVLFSTALYWVIAWLVLGAITAKK
jgi:hypothetical protein